MGSLANLRSLIANGQVTEAMQLHRELVRRYKDSPSLSFALDKLAQDLEEKGETCSRKSSEIKSDLQKNTSLKKSGAKEYQYKRLNLEKILATLLVKSSVDSIFSVWPEGSQLKIKQGSCLLPIQSVLPSRIHFRIRNYTNSRFSICYSPLTNGTLSGATDEVTWINENKEFIADINPDRGQAWLKISKQDDAEGQIALVQFESGRIRRPIFPEVLVVVPFHNDEDFLPMAISSIKKQTYKGKIGVVVINDFSDEKSTSKAKNIIKDFAGHLDIEIIHHERNKHLSEARNTGLCAKKSDLVQLLDSDDLLHASCIERKVEAFLEDTDPLCIGSYSKINLVPHNTTLRDIQARPVASGLERMTLLGSSGRCPTNCHGPLVSYRHFHALGLFSPSIRRGAEDYDFWVRLLSLGFELKETPFVLGHYRMKKAGSMSRDDVEPHYLETIRILHEVYNKPISQFLGQSFADWPYRLKSGLSDLFYKRQIAERYIRYLTIRACNQSKTEGPESLGEERLLDQPWTTFDLEYFSYCEVPSKLNHQFANINNIISMNIKRALGWSKNTNEDLREEVFHTVYEQLYCSPSYEAENSQCSHSQNVSEVAAISKGLLRLERPEGSDIEEIKFYRNRYKGRRCFVIGNGPSLNKHDLSLLANEYSFGVNGIFYKTETSGFVPTFYVVEDNMVMKENLDRIHEYRPLIRKFFPTDYKSLHPKDGKTSFFTMNRAFYTKNSPYFEKPQFSTDASKRVFCGQSVTIINLQLAFYMGFTEVYLIGMDFSYKVNQETQEVQKNSVHILSKGDDENHFHPEYFGKGKTWKDPKLHNVEASYVKCKEVYENHGRRIYNASVGGELEVFERVFYHDLFV